MKTNSNSNNCPECEQLLVKSIEGIPLYYSFKPTQSQQLIKPALGQSIQSPKYKDMISNKNVKHSECCAKYSECCAKYNLLIAGVVILGIIVFLILYQSRKH